MKPRIAHTCLGLASPTGAERADSLQLSPGISFPTQNLEVHIPGTLAAGIEVLVYAGDQDFICNVEGNRRWVESMVWDGQLEFAQAPLTDWVLDSDAVAGQFRSAKGLTFLNVHGAGHMVPMDQPEAALDMLEMFTKARGTFVVSLAPVATLRCSLPIHAHSHCTEGSSWQTAAEQANAVILQIKENKFHPADPKAAKLSRVPLAGKAAAQATNAAKAAAGKVADLISSVFGRRGGKAFQNRVQQE